MQVASVEKMHESKTRALYRYKAKKICDWPKEFVNFVESFNRPLYARRQFVIPWIQLVVHSMPTKKQLGLAELFGTWPSLTGQDEIDCALRSVAVALWPYARFCAWSYLYDEDYAYDLMDYALINVSAYARRCQPPPTEAKVYARLRSVLARLVKQEARHRRELLVGGLFDLEKHAAATGLVGEQEVENKILLQEIFSRLSPSAQRIAGLVAMGYSWREIGRQLRIDHQTVHRSFLREVNVALKSAKKSDP